MSASSLPPHSPASGRSPVDGYADGSETAADRVGDLRAPVSSADVEALAAELEPEAFDPDQPADEEWRERTRNVALAHAARVLAAGWRRDPDPAAVLDELADDLDARAHQREQVGDDDGEACEDECEEVTCHTVAAVATWFRAAGVVRRRAAVLRGGEQPPEPGKQASDLGTGNATGRGAFPQVNGTGQGGGEQP